MNSKPAAEARKRGLDAAQDGRAAAADPPSTASRLRTVRLDGLAAFAPLLGTAAALSALVVALALRRNVPVAPLAGWCLTVALAAWLAIARIARTATAHSGRDVPRIVGAANAALVGLVAVTWIAAPALAYAHVPEPARIAIAVSAAALICAGLAIASAPAAAIAWAGVLAGGLGVAIARSGGAERPVLLATLCVHSALVMAVARRVARLIDGCAGLVAGEQATAAAAVQLLREYEERGTSCLWQTDAGHIVRYVTPAAAAMLGRPSTALTGLSLAIIVGGSEALGAALIARATFAGIEIELGDGAGRRAIAISGTPILDAAGAFAGFRGACADVTEARSSERRLRQLASLDMLTGLPNRMRMREIVADALLAAHAGGPPCGLMMLDLDGFKPVNDSFGHPAGDALLKAMAARLVAEVGEAGIVGRLGGDEFAVALRDAGDRAPVAALAGRLIDIASAAFSLDQGSARVGLSIGIACAPFDGDTVEELVKRADLALYEAKAAGRGTWRHFAPAMEAAAEERLRTEQDLRRALPLGQLRLAYQPVIRVSDRRVVAFEALVRWHHPVRGVLTPGDFLAIAEETGLIEEIGDWVLTTAIADCARLPDPIAVAVNLSPVQLRHAGLPARVADALARARLPANRLELEVDERIFTGDTIMVLDVLRRLRGQGVRIALDDFGTGRSSLGALNRAIFTRLKIDGSFVRDAGAREEAMAIVRAMVALADCLGMTITAEGVETADDYARMAELGCHRAQGYLLGRPVPFEHAVAQARGAMPPLPSAVNG